MATFYVMNQAIILNIVKLLFKFVNGPIFLNDLTRVLKNKQYKPLVKLIYY